MSSLPEEIYLEILLRVPDVKSTFVCRCVCKKWYALISDPDFVKTHLDLAIQRNNCRLMVQGVEEINVYSISSTEFDVVEMDLEFPYKSSGHKIELLGSCNGLVYGWNDHKKFFFLWNPATREHKRLPKSRRVDCGYHGLGYDYKTNDYKLVNIYKTIEHILDSVYSLKSNSWKSLQSIPYEFHCWQRSGVFLNGALHWFVEKGKEASSIVSMDISEETFEELQLPKTPRPVNMGVLEGCLCVLGEFEETFDVWVMQDYGVPESWARLYTITYRSIFYPSRDDVELIGSLKDGVILFMAGCKVISYDSKDGTARKTVIHSMVEGGAVKYVESLVSINFIAAMGRTKKRESTIKKKNRNMPKHL